MILKGNLIKCSRHFLQIRTMSRTLSGKIEGALIDLSGTVHVEDKIVGNSVTAIEKLRAANIKIRFVTNTTKESVSTLYNRLVKLGVKLEKDEIWSSLTAASKYIKDKNLNPFYIASEDALSQLPPVDESKPLNAVVVGLAPDKFCFEYFNKALDVLRKGGVLIAIHAGRFYKTSSGYAVGPGFVAKGLEYSTGVSPIVIGKPDPLFFQSGIPEGLEPAKCVMIGDDPVDDIEGAQKLGMQTILVTKTGKFAGYEIPPEVDSVMVDDIEAAVELILNAK
ncbi:haloacid dehalogenase-like hydrolase domain-containing protein 2 [Culicoides brevitarsis]|uniref:haloacid dehalogenase-like hydrolase domain-containing protein 2 n=1 Tax=Culicoides brevitarsis TaxID=469753 RepID=UPI00307C2E17